MERASRRNFLAALGLAGPVVASVPEKGDAVLTGISTVRPIHPTRTLKGPARIAELRVKNYEEERHLLSHLKPGMFVCMTKRDSGRPWGWKSVIVEHPKLFLSPEGCDPIIMNWRIHDGYLEVGGWEFRNVDISRPIWTRLA